MTIILSPSEKQILHLTAEGCTDLEIAVMRGTALETIKSQQINIRNKLGAVNRTNAVSIGYQKGILKGGE